MKFSTIPVHSIKNGKCTCGDPDCDKPGKHPRLNAWKQYQKRVPTAEEIATWGEAYPGCNWGFVTGQAESAGKIRRLK
jgi:ribosomal protein S30